MTTKDLCERLSITPRALQWWCDLHLLRPARSGHAFRFDEHAAAQAAVIADLRGKGVSLHRIRRLKLSEFPADYLVVEAARRRYCYCTEDELLPYMLDAPGGCYVVCIKDLRARLQAGPQKARKAVH